MSELVKCPYCSRTAEFVDSERIYGQSYGMIYLCVPCEAYVGVHKGTSRPLGTLANAETRLWRKTAHAKFDPLWRAGKTTRSQAYLWMQRAMKLTRAQAHIARFTVDQCRELVHLIEAKEIVWQ